MAKALGEKTLGVDDSKIPSTAAVRRVEERVEELGPIFEEREEAMFAIKEEVSWYIFLIQNGLVTMPLGSSGRR